MYLVHVPKEDIVAFIDVDGSNVGGELFGKKVYSPIEGVTTDLGAEGLVCLHPEIENIRKYFMSLGVPEEIIFSQEDIGKLIGGRLTYKSAMVIGPEIINGRKKLRYYLRN